MAVGDGCGAALKDFFDQKVLLAPILTSRLAIALIVSRAMYAAVFAVTLVVGALTISPWHLIFFMLCWPFVPLMRATNGGCT